MVDRDLSPKCSGGTVPGHEKTAESLIRRFTVENYDERYHILDRLNVKTLFTTNIDNLLYLIYSKSKRSYLSDIDTSGPDFRDRRAVQLVTLHGSVTDEDREFRFGAPALASSFASDPDRWHFLAHRMQEHPTLFWGYSVNDAATLQVLNPETRLGRPVREKWIIVHPSSLEDTVAYYRALGFQIIVVDTSMMLDYLHKNAPELPQVVISPTISTSELFPAEAIPDVGSVPVRPIIHFYLGATPQWHDIYSGNIYRVSHYYRIRNSANSGKNTIITGMPMCGKTTLLMQMAVDDFPVQHKLVTDSLTLQKARFITNRLEGQKALVFLDNFADSLEAYEYLSAQSNIQLVCADRDYNFGIVGHRIDRSAVNIIDVTELSPADIQSCLRMIPQAIKSSAFNLPRVSSGVDPSLFEIIEANVTRPSLKSRFASVLKELLRRDRDLHDLLVMLSYVYQCRVPVSMDMLFAYLREVTNDWREIYAMCDRLGAMIADYGGNLVFIEQQDYFVPRSTAVAEAVMENVYSNHMRKMLIRFHENVSPYRICRYDIFRRSAYDHKVFRKAFSNWKEGKTFYERLFERDRSPYMLQHCALFLAGKQRYVEAFDVIDRAITISGGHIWTIRNSHAIILFKANYPHATAPEARQSLRHSMEILTQCYKSDKRKPFHAATFADYAMKYWDVYRDEEAMEYLQTAESWLEDEAIRSPWYRSTKQLLPRVKRKLQSASSY